MPNHTLSVRDFSIIYNLVNSEIQKHETFNLYLYFNVGTEKDRDKEEKKYKESLKTNVHYQDLLRIRECLGSLDIEIKTPDVKINTN